MTSRRHRSARERERLFLLHEKRCHLCGQQIKPGEAFELEHVIPWELTRDDSDDNVKPAHVKCHAGKTADDIRGIRKADRNRQKHYGIRTKSSRPLPGGRNDKLMKKLDGRTVLRGTR